MKRELDPYTLLFVAALARRAARAARRDAKVITGGEAYFGEAYFDGYANSAKHCADYLTKLAKSTPATLRKPATKAKRKGRRE